VTFQKTKKPFIFTYFKDIESNTEDSLEAFKNKLKDLGHFYTTYSTFDNLWNQFNKELDRLLLAEFEVNEIVQNIINIKNQFNNGTFDNTTFN